MSAFSDGYDPITFWQRFEHRHATIDGVRLHYVEGGNGAPVLLIPGWPQSWYAWRKVMPLLADAGHRVIAIDPRGMGDSARPATGYDMTTVAAELHAFLNALELGMGVDVVGHDIGSWMAFALAADWPRDVRRLAMFDVTIPGVSLPPPSGIPSTEFNAKTWQFSFQRLDDLPELLLIGRERPFLTWLFQRKAARPWSMMGPADLDEYVRVFAAPGAIRAALSFYRCAFSDVDVAANRARAARRLSQPVLAMGAESGIGDTLLEAFRGIADDVRGGTLMDCGHYMPEESPLDIAAAVIDFLHAG